MKMIDLNAAVLLALFLWMASSTTAQYSSDVTTTGAYPSPLDATTAGPSEVPDDGSSEVSTPSVPTTEAGQVGSEPVDPTTTLSPSSTTSNGVSTSPDVGSDNTTSSSSGKICLPESAVVSSFEFQRSIANSMLDIINKVISGMKSNGGRNKRSVGRSERRPLGLGFYRKEEDTLSLRDAYLLKHNAILLIDHASIYCGKFPNASKQENSSYGQSGGNAFDGAVSQSAALAVAYNSGKDQVSAKPPNNENWSGHWSAQTTAAEPEMAVDQPQSSSTEVSGAEQDDNDGRSFKGRGLAFGLRGRVQNKFLNDNNSDKSDERDKDSVERSVSASGQVGTPGRASLSAASTGLIAPSSVLDPLKPVDLSFHGESSLDSRVKRATRKTAAPICSISGDICIDTEIGIIPNVAHY